MLGLAFEVKNLKEKQIKENIIIPDQMTMNEFNRNMDSRVKIDNLNFPLENV